MEAQKFFYETRPCDCCGNDQLESLYSFEHIAITSKNKWKFEVHNVICPQCGFVFVSPSPSADRLLEYYAETFVKYEEQQLDFNASKRINFIEESVVSPFRETFLELGAHNKTSFHLMLESVFEKVYTIEPNESANKDYDNLKSFLNLKLDVIAHYFVLEHVPNVISFLKQCYDRLRDGGIMICEVPDLLLYPKDISALILHEHVNHFTPPVLIQICESLGFKMLSYSHSSCSRSFGFVCAFEKTAASNQNSKLESQYVINRGAFMAGLRQLDLFREKKYKILDMIEDLRKANQKVLVWGANDNLLRMFFSEAEIPSNVVVVDSNPKKKDFFTNKKVMLPIEIIDMLHDISVIILMTNLHARSILDTLKNSFNKTFHKENIHLFDFYNPLN